jgi:ribosomal protein S18 acetylase RimI-like enzyme
VSGRFRIEALASAHDRAGFTSGSGPLDRYLREQASQDVRRRTSACYVAVDASSAGVAGYYTLAAGSVPLADIPAAMAKKLPRYPVVPVARVGRLAVGLNFQKQQLGAALLWDAGLRSMASGIGVFALLVDAKDEAAVAFYRHHGFVAFGNQPRTLVLPIATLAAKG